MCASSCIKQYVQPSYGCRGMPVVAGMLILREKIISYLRPYQINYLFIIPSLSNFGPWQKNYLFFCACARCALIRISVCTNQKLTQKMVFVIVQIRSGATILKTWYGCSIPEGSSLAEVYTSFSSGLNTN